MSRLSRPSWASNLHPVRLDLPVMLVLLTMLKNRSIGWQHRVHLKPKLTPKKQVFNIAPVPAKKMTIAMNVKLTFNCCNPNEIATFNVKLTFIVKS